MCGTLVAIVAPVLPSGEGTSRTGLVGVGSVAVAAGVAIWFLPWDRWERRASLWLIPSALLLIAGHNYFTGADGYRFALFFLVNATWNGLGHRQWTTLKFSPLMVVAYITPLLLHDASAVALASVVYAAPAYVLVGETVAWVAQRLRQSEAARQVSETRLQSLVENAADMITVLDSDGRIIYDSPASERLLGYPSDGRLGDRALDYVHHEDAQDVRRLVTRLRDRPGQVDRTELRLRHADGSWRWVALVVRNLLDDPAIGGFVANLSDITERKKDQERLKRSEQAYRLLFEGNPLPLWVYDLETLGFLAVNEAAVQHYGYWRDEFLSMTIADVRPPEDIPALLEDVEGARTRGASTGRWRHLKKDGTLIEVEVTTMPLEFGGRPARLALMNDVTARVRAEAELRASEDRFRSLVQHAHDVVVLLAADGTPRYVSPSIEDMLGWKATGLPAILGPEHLHPDDHPAVLANFARVLAEPGYHPPIEARVRHADGSWRWLELVHTNMLGNPAVEGVVVNIRDVTERKEAEEQLAHQALHDALTDLPNRALFCDRLGHALRRAEQVRGRVAVLFVDIDRFKMVNDSLGHGAGDEILVQMAAVLNGAVRPTDTVARVGGDEFVICCEEVSTEQDAVEVALRVRQRLQQPFAIAGREVHVTVSVGITLSSADDEDTPDSLLRNADAALYRAKERGRDRHELFDDETRRRLVDRLTVETELRTALDHGELTVHYQPVLSLTDDDVVGAEALVRWRHPQRGVVAPGVFVPVAEESGLIVRLGDQVLRAACRDVARLADRPGAPRLSVAVNLSARQLMEPDLPRAVASALADTGLTPHALQLEITETALMTDPDRAGRALRALKNLGVRIAVDDFGTGYSSLAYLRRFPIDVVKIDRSFVAGLGSSAEDTAIVEGVVRLADALGLIAVAEGVETDEQLAELRRLGCPRAQGYLWSAALPHDELVGWLDTRAAARHAVAQTQPA